MSPKRAPREEGTPKWVKNHRKGMHHRSETYAKEFAAAEQRVEKADAMPRGTEKEAKLRKEALMEAEETRKMSWGEL